MAGDATIPARPDASLTSTTDVILAIQEPYMTQIVDGVKNYEFRKYRLESSIERIWFYCTAPHSSITYVCEIQPARTRNAGDAPLEEDGLGNKEFNERHMEWEGYDFAYKILSVNELEKPILLAELKAKFGMISAPRGLVCLPSSIAEEIKWQQQKKIR